jgi:hypothetical protein
MRGSARRNRALQACGLVAAYCLLLSSAALAQDVTVQQTLLIGDSITQDWTDVPVRYGYSAQQSCTIRLHLAAAMAQNPQIRRVVIEAGTDDITQGPGAGFDCPLPTQDPVSSIVDMVKTAKAAGMQVFVLSVLPISWNNRAGQPCEPFVAPFNATLQAAITAAGAYWVDDYDAFVGHPEYQYDGVHPTLYGYQVIENVYFTTVCADVGECSYVRRVKR